MSEKKVESKQISITLKGHIIKQIESRVSESIGINSRQEYIRNLIQEGLNKPIKFKTYINKNDYEEIKNYYKFFSPIITNLNQMAKKLNALDEKSPHIKELENISENLNRLIKIPFKKLSK